MSAFSVEKIGLEQSQQFATLFRDYIAQQESVQSLYAFYPDVAGLETAIQARSQRHINRSVLVERIKAQYGELTITGKVGANIELLLNDNTFTIPTGNQLCLGTGPLSIILQTLSCV